jgi:hypothetical protein
MEGHVNAVSEWLFFGQSERDLFFRVEASVLSLSPAAYGPVGARL